MLDLIGILLGVILGTIWGYWQRDMWDRLGAILAAVKNIKVTRQQAEVAKRKSGPTFIDADDVVTQVRMEHAERMKILNPDDNDKS